jgi:hypothetical protein
MEPKVLLSIYVQGAKLLPQSVCENTENCELNHLKLGKHTLSFLTRKSEKAVIKTKITDEAYAHMVSTSYPIGCSPVKWKQMSKKQRLEAHLLNMAQLYNSNEYTYEFIDN